VYDVNNMAYIYFNGIEDARIPASGTVEATDASVYLGTRSNVAGTAPDGWGASFFDGMLDDVRFYNHALEEAELGPIMEGKEEVPGPLAARPNPANEATGVPMDTTLSWKPGLFADKPAFSNSARGIIGGSMKSMHHPRPQSIKVTSGAL